MKVEFNTYEQRPQFKASFAKTAETKKALKAFCEKDHYRLYELKTVLKKAKVKDIIEVYINNNGTNPPNFLFRNTATDCFVNSADRGYRDGISNLLFSNGKKVEDYEPAPLTCLPKDAKYNDSRLEKKLREEADTIEDRKMINEVLDMAYELDEMASKLSDAYKHFRKFAEKKEKDYLMKDLDLLD